MSILASILGVTQEVGLILLSIFVFPDSDVNGVFGPQTLSHRKLVQELYDSRILHKMLGVDTALKRAPQVVNGAGTNKGVHGSKSSGEAQNAVHSAWASEADTDKQLSDDDGARQVAEDTEAEEGRYDIPPPKKRRKTGRSDKDEHTVLYVSGSEDEKEDEAYSGQKREVDRERGDRKDDSRRDTESADRRRSYWLSKGIGLGGDEDSS